MTCKNCDHSTEGNFCIHCGQSTKVDRINLHNFLSEISSSVFQINKGLFYSMKELFVRPGHSIREYLSGKRKNHFKPIAYAFTLSTIYFLLSQFLESGTFMNDAIEGFLNSSSTTPEGDTHELAILNWFAKNYAYTVLMLLPLFSLASYLAFLRSGYNYLEHFVLNAYITGQQAIIYSFAAILSLIINNHDLLASSSLYISIAYTVFVFWQFFSKQSRIAIVLRSILTYALYLIMLMLVLFTIFFALK